LTCEAVRLGVVGLGLAFMLMLPAFRADPRVRLVAAAAPREASRAAFVEEFAGKAYPSIDDLCADPEVEAIYVASPHELHRDHVLAAARSGKHVLVDKPLAISMEDGRAMVEACQRAGVHLIVGPSHSFDGPVALARCLIDEGSIGAVRMIHALNFTDFLYRPRRVEELDTTRGGGVVFSQGVHQIDIVRLLAGGKAAQVMAHTGNWDSGRPTEGAYSALMSFNGGAFASLSYSGYAHFDSDEWMDWIGELGHRKDPQQYGNARRRLSAVASSQEEAALKSARTYGAGETLPAPQHHEHFGPIIVCGDRGDLRLTPQGVILFGDDSRMVYATKSVDIPRVEVIDALYEAVRQDRLPAQTGAWGLASLEVCHAILQSAATGRAVDLHHQISVTGDA
jgi:phthalate 4,5-cis-dihydrodiol dehydrogenase